MATPQYVKADAIVCAEIALPVTQSSLPVKAEKTPAVAVSEPLQDGACLPTQVVTTTQPTPTADLKLGLKVKDGPGVPVSRSTDIYRRFKAVLHGVLHGVRSFFVKALTLLWIGVVYVFPGAVMSVLVAVILISIPLAIAAALGAIVMLTGNGVLRAAHLAHYTDNMSAAAIGSLGAVVSSLVLLLPLRLIGINYNKENQHNPPMLFRIIISVVLHTLSGALGSSILLSFHVDLGPIDVLHATRAGAVGGAILGPGLVIAIPLIVVALGLVIAPLWIGLELVLKWYRGQLSDAYNGETFGCMCYEICDDLWDEDIV